MLVNAIIVGAGGRGHVYSNFALSYPKEMRIIGVAEPDKLRRDKIVKRHQIPSEMIFDSWQSLIEHDKLDAVILNCTMDRLHFASTTKMLEKGYDVLLEKPVSPILSENVKLVQQAEKLGRTLQVCHVLRYTPFWQKMYDIVNSGILGQIINVSHQENLAYWHMAHSFVRGNWRNEADAGSMLLSKCCHDFDILYWLLRKKVVWISSFGSLSHFHSGNAPEGAPQYCTDGCPVADTCKYEATRLYINDKNKWTADTLEPNAPDDLRLEALKNRSYGRCVFHCENTVVDHQVVNMELEGGTTVTLTMNGHGEEEYRSMRYDGTKATLFAKFAESGNEIRIHHHLNDLIEEVSVIDNGESGHGGGDFGIVRSFLDTIKGHPDDNFTSARNSLESHFLAFAAEEARHKKIVINMQEYRENLET